MALRDWLEGRRAELAGRLGQELPRPVFAEQPGAAEDPETARIRSALLTGVSAETPGAIAWDVVSAALAPCVECFGDLPLEQGLIIAAHHNLSAPFTGAAMTSTSA